MKFHQNKTSQLMMGEDHWAWGPHKKRKRFSAQLSTFLLYYLLLDTCPWCQSRGTLGEKNKPPSKLVLNALSHHLHLHHMSMAIITGGVKRLNFPKYKNRNAVWIDWKELGWENNGTYCNFTAKLIWISL